jgi:hypothetical protein
MPRNCKKVYSLDLDGRNLAMKTKALSLMKLRKIQKIPQSKEDEKAGGN